MEQLFTFISLGFNASCALFFILRFFSTGSAYYIYIALVSVMQSVYMIFSNRDVLALFDSGYHPLLYLVSSVGLSAVVLFFFLFLRAFLDLRKERIMRVILSFGCVYMVAGILCKILRLNYEWASYASLNFFVKYYVVIDALVMGTLLIYLLRKRRPHMIYLVLAIVGLIISALFIHAKDYFGIEISKYHLRQIEVMLGSVFFFLAIIEKEKEMEEENKRIRGELAYADIQRQKEIIEERDRIARDLHDEIGAGVSAIKLQLELLNLKKKDAEEDIEELLLMSENINQSMRTMIRNLNTSPIDTGAFINHISEYTEHFLAKAGIILNVNRTLAHESRQLAPTVTHNLFLCVKEALNNIYKHSKATEAVLTVLQDDTTLAITIKDNGVGLSGSLHSDSYGLNNIKTRMDSIQGIFALTSEKGVEVLFEVKY